MLDCFVFCCFFVLKIYLWFEDVYCNIFQILDFFKYELEIIKGIVENKRYGINIDLYNLRFY